MLLKTDDIIWKRQRDGSGLDRSYGQEVETGNRRGTDSNLS